MKRVLSGLCGVALAAALIGTAPALATSKQAQSKNFKVAGTRGAITHRASVNLASAVASQKPLTAAQKAAAQATYNRGQAILNRRGHGTPAAQKAATPVPPFIWPIHNGAAQASQRFMGLTSVDSYNVNGFHVQPPDQGMCVGQGKILEMINLATQVYAYDGTPQLRSALALNTFFGTPSFFDGFFLSDPQCTYDPGTNLWYATVLEIDFNTLNTYILIAVSQNSDPTQFWNVFSINTTFDGNDQGKENRPDCPCLGDQPFLGLDGSGVYISTNSYSLINPFYNGAQLYVIPKNALLHQFGVYFHYDTFGAPFPGIGNCEGQPKFLKNCQLYSLQTTRSQDGTSTGVNNGTMYMLGTGDFCTPFFTQVECGGDITDDVVLGAFTDTNALNFSDPQAPDLTIVSFHPGVNYQFPVLATQKDGKIPLGQQYNEPEGKVATNDDRMLQTWWDRAGHVWGAANTKVTGPGPNNLGRTAVIYWEVRPDWVAGLLQGEALSVGYVATNYNTFFPSVTYSNNGHVVIAMNLSGSAYFPSAAYVDFTPANQTGTVNVYQAGINPEDGFCEYPEFNCGQTNPPTARPRFGDYSAATALPTGNDVFIANEFNPDDAFRDALTNDATFIGHIPTP